MTTSHSPAVTEPTDTAAGRSATPLLVADGLTKSFAQRGGLISRSHGGVRAVDGVSLAVRAGETVGIVGESGSGKSTFGRLITRLLPIDEGSLRFGGTDVAQLRRNALRDFRRHVQMIHQNPYGSLDPTKTAAHAITEPLVVHRLAPRGELMARAAELAERVALHPELIHRRPHELSGGQRQRVAIARSLALAPSVLVADEPTSALDLSTRSEILNLLLELQVRDGLAIVLITHDFATVRHLSHHIAVMYLGRIVEQGPAEQVASEPLHPYTEALLSAVPVADPVVQRARRRIVLAGELPSAVAIPSGCRFRSRCPKAMPECATVDPELREVRAGHQAACLLYDGAPAQ